ncbi:MAG: ABC transporter ATP-binding protein [Candidatus Fermentibacteraceae bacterium]
MTQAAVAIEGLHVRYGRIMALDGLDMRVPAGGVTGLLGRNGAGKTTTIRAILGLVRPREGEIRVLDSPPSRTTRARTSVLFAEHGLVPEMTLMENLVCWGMINSLGLAEARSRAEAVLHTLGTLHSAAAPVRELSSGNRRLAGIARAFMLPRDLVLLDEPTASLDPVRAEEIRAGIRELAGHSAVLLSTHNLVEAEELCDRVVIIHNGRRLAGGTPEELSEPGDVHLVRTESGTALFRGQRHRPDGKGFVRLDSGVSAADTLAELLREGNRVVEFRPERKSLSQTFLELAEEES